jgi:hypothetical protein
VVPLLEHGATEKEAIAALTDAVPLHAVLDPQSDEVKGNRADVALAKIDLGEATVDSDSGLYTLQQCQLTAPPLGEPPAPLWATVAKVGRTTAATLGTVVDVNANIWVPMREKTGHTALAFFVNQIAVVPLGPYPTFSAAGDSGSIVYNVKSGTPVGLLFAGGDGTTFLNPWLAVVEELEKKTGKHLKLWEPTS